MRLRNWIKIWNGCWVAWRIFLREHFFSRGENFVIKKIGHFFRGGESWVYKVCDLDEIFEECTNELHTTWFPCNQKSIYGGMGNMLCWKNKLIKWRFFTNNLVNAFWTKSSNLVLLYFYYLLSRDFMFYNHCFVYDDQCFFVRACLWGKSIFYDDV